VQNATCVQVSMYFRRRANSHDLFLKLSFSCDRDAVSTDSHWNSQRLFGARQRRAAEKLIEFGQEKSGKSQEISRVRSCDSPVFVT